MRTPMIKLNHSKFDSATRSIEDMELWLVQHVVFLFSHSDDDMEVTRHLLPSSPGTTLLSCLRTSYHQVNLF
jgi:hypothetical protein